MTRSLALRIALWTATLFVLGHLTWGMADWHDWKARHSDHSSLTTTQGDWFSDQIAVSRVPMVPYPVTVHYGVQRKDMSETQGWTYEGAREIWIGEDVWHDRHVFYHEMGHLYDHGMSQSDRDKFARLLHDHHGWRERRGGDYEGSLSEWFADYYASCAQHWDTTPYVLKGTKDPWVEGYAKPSISAATYREVCWMIKDSTWVGGGV